MSINTIQQSSTWSSRHAICVWLVTIQFKCLTGQHLVNVALPLVHQVHHEVGGGAHVQCPCRRRRHVMFRDIDCIVLKRLCAWVVLQLRMLASCYAADSLRRRLSALLLYFMSVCHSFLVCMRDGSPNISYFHRWKSNENMRWWNDDDETVSSPTEVFGVSDHDGDRPV